MHIKHLLLLLVLAAAGLGTRAAGRQKLNFNSGWLLRLGPAEGAEAPDYDDHAWQRVTLPRAWNEAEAFRRPIHQLSDTTMWYRKHFRLRAVAGRKFFVEFEGVRFGAEVYVNGHRLGLTENGVMASGWDLTPYVHEGENVIAVWVDSSWRYHERSSGSPYQWNDRNFNANYGGIPKNVWLHETDRLYQTLPLYSNLQTTGVYVYGTDYDIVGHAVTLHAESQVRNDDDRPRSFTYRCEVADKDGRTVARFGGRRVTMQPGETCNVAAEGRLTGAHFWSWGYGYLYTVTTRLMADDGTPVDDHVVRTGFRKTRFAEGRIWLNDRIIMMHGYAQRTSNEWPGVGMSVPAWLSDFSNRLQVESGGNLVRWMHVTPWKQDVESCDRMGLIQAMPAGDAEKDVTGRRWEQRVELMRDAIIYNRNNPSILFYEGGNESISPEHMAELRRLRDRYDPHGGRAIGSREMLDVDEAEYGGEMLYVNKSKGKPYWQMEYYRDEGLRKYWDDYSYPFHREGAGPLYRGAPAPDYNHNQDRLACGMVERWHDYFVDRPGTGRRVNSGGAKIVFSDTNTHFRGEANYRTSGVTDAMRIPKDAFFAHQVMWNGWVTPEHDGTHIIGHWNYEPGTVKPVYVVSTGDDVELLVNGRSIGHGRRSHEYLFTVDSVAFEPGRLEAVSRRDGRVVARHTIETAGPADHLRATVIGNPLGFKADGADMALVQVEVVDAEGRRCPLDNRMVNFSLSVEGEWLGGIARPVGPCTNDDAAVPAHTASGPTTRPNGSAATGQGRPGLLDGPATTSAFGNYIRELSLPVECGVNRVLVRSTPTPGVITLHALADGLKPVTLELHTTALDTRDGVSSYNPGLALPLCLDRGETPATPSCRDVRRTLDVTSIQVGSNAADALKAIDDNELSEWKSDGTPANAWATFTLARPARVDEVVLKLTGWRNKVYPLAIYAGQQKVWEGWTYATLGYVHIDIPRGVKSRSLTIRMLGPSRDSTKFGEIKELAGGATGELDRTASAKGRTELRIVEIDLLQKTE